MKETYYKLNREKAEEMFKYDDYEYETFNTLCALGILEEVQEEYTEMFKAEEAYNKQADKIEKRVKEAKEESKQAIDNMFGNPLGQIDNMIEGTKVEEVCEHSELVSEVRWHQFPDYEMGDSEKYYVLVCKKCGEEDINVSNAYGKSLAPYQAAAQEAENIAMNEAIDGKPFLDGISPIDWTKKFMEYNKSSIDEELSLNGRYIAALLTLLDLLVEELKKNNVIK